MFSIITMASSTTKPVEIGQRHQRELLMEKPARYITPKVPTSDSGTAKLGMSVAGSCAGTQKSPPPPDQWPAPARSAYVFDRGADGGGAVGQHLNIHRRRQRGLQLGQRLMRSTVSITLAPGWRRMLRMTPDLEPVSGVPAQAARRVFSASSTVCAHRAGGWGAVLEGDELAVFGRRLELVVGVDGGCTGAGRQSRPLACLTLAAAMECARLPA